MKYLILPITCFLFCFIAFGQLNTAKLNADVFARSVMPTYDEELKKVKAYQDSLTQVITSDPNYAKFKNDIENVDQNDAKSVGNYRVAQSYLNQKYASLERMVGIEYQKRVAPAREALNSLKGFQEKRNIDLVILYGDQGYQNIEYASQEKEQAVNQLLMQCMKIPDGLSAEEYLKLQNERLPGCREQVLANLWKDGQDITQAFIDSLK